MLIDRHPSENVFARVPEVAAQTDPVLKQLDVLLEDDELYQQVRDDLGKRYTWTLVHGRHSTPVEVILRMLLCKHLYQWSYRETEERVKDSLILRWFCRVYFEQVPDETTLLRWLHTLRPETLHALNDRVVQLAAQAKVTKGRKLRLDATCVQTTIHHPTDSGLLVDSVRVLSRVVQRAKVLIKDEVKSVQQVCRSRLQTARRLAQTRHSTVAAQRRRERSRTESALSEARRDHRAHGAADQTGGHGSEPAPGTAGRAAHDPGERGAPADRARDHANAHPRAGRQKGRLRPEGAQPL
jgi:transposase, IS5 family